jgi:hypothetical protein
MGTDEILKGGQQGCVVLDDSYGFQVGQGQVLSRIERLNKVSNRCSRARNVSIIPTFTSGNPFSGAAVARRHPGPLSPRLSDA